MKKFINGLSKISEACDIRNLNVHEATGTIDIAAYEDLLIRVRAILTIKNDIKIRHVI